jgi:DNA-binding NarL/FixJ family response regulator
VSDTVTVLVADDHPPTRAGVRASLEGDGFAIVAEVGDAPSAVKSALSLQPKVCLLDIHMPGNGISAAGQISNALTDTAIIMLTVSRNDDDLFDAIRAGACGYLLKDTDPDRLPIALRAALAGEAALPRTLVTRLMDEFRGRGAGRTVPLFGGHSVSLTSREWEVLDLMKDGCTTEQMAERLFISKVTVRSHVSSLLRKLKVRDRAEAVSLMRQE